MTDNSSSNETQKPSTPAPTPQQNQGDPKQNSDKQGGQQQQK